MLRYLHKYMLKFGRCFVKKLKCSHHQKHLLERNILLEALAKQRNFKKKINEGYRRQLINGTNTSAGWSPNYCVMISPLILTA